MYDFFFYDIYVKCLWFCYCKYIYVYLVNYFYKNVNIKK